MTNSKKKTALILSMVAAVMFFTSLNAQAATVTDKFYWKVWEKYDTSNTVLADADIFEMPLNYVIEGSITYDTAIFNGINMDIYMDPLDGVGGEELAFGTGFYPTGSGLFSAQLVMNKHTQTSMDPGSLIDVRQPDSVSFDEGLLQSVGLFPAFNDDGVFDFNPDGIYSIYATLDRYYDWELNEWVNEGAMWISYNSASLYQAEVVGFDANNHVNTLQSPVPVPGAAWLLGSGLIGLVGIRRRFTN